MGGLGYAELAKALSGGGQQYQSPWLAAAQSLPQAAPGNDIEQMIGGMTRALMAGYGMYDQNQEQRRVGGLYARAFQENPDQTAMAELLANPQTAPIALFQMSQSASKKQRSEDLSNDLLKVGYGKMLDAATSPDNLRRVSMKMPGALDPQAIMARYLDPNYRQTLGQMPQGGTLPAGPAPGMAQAPQPIPVSSIEQQQASGTQTPPTLEDKVTQLANHFSLNLGLDPDSAVQRAQQQLAPEVESSTAKLKALSETRQAAIRRLNMAQGIKAILPNVGETGWGSDIGTMAMGAGGALQGLLKMQGTDWQKTYDARQQLEAYKPEIIATAKEGIPGNMTDPEMRLYEGAGTNVNQTPATNALLVGSLEGRAKYNLAYVDFMQNWFNKYGTLENGADRVWRESMGDYFPVVVNPQTGEAVANPNVPDWKERTAPYFGGSPNPTQGQGGAANPPAPEIPSAQNSSVLAAMPGGPDPSQFGVRPELSRALRQTESGNKQFPEGNPDAIGPETKYGRAIGMNQILTSTAKPHLRDMGLIQPGTPDDQIVELLKNPSINEEVKLREFSTLLKQYKGDEKLALAAYNAGQGNVKQYGGVPPFLETQKYIAKISGKTPLYGPEDAQAQDVVPSPGPQSPQQIVTQSPETPQNVDPRQFYKRGVSPKDMIRDVQNLYQGAAANFGDEAIAAMQMAPQLGKRFGTPEEQQQFANELELRRTAIEQQINDINPGRAGVLRTAGSLMTLPLIPAKTPILGAKAITEASTLGRIARTGAGGGILSAIYGAGDAQPGKRGEKAIESAVIGVPAGMLLGAGVEAGAGALNKLPDAVKSTIGNLSRLGANEKGAITIGGKKSPQMSAGGMAIYKRAGSPSASDLETALARMNDAEAKGGSLLLPEAADKESLYRTGQYLRNIGTEKTQNMASEFVAERAAQAGPRIEQAFEQSGAVSSAPTSRLNSAKSAQAGANALWKTEAEARKAIAKPLFDKAFKKVPEMQSPALTKALETDIGKEAVRIARRQPGLENVPETNSELIQSATQYLGERVKKLAKNPDVTATEVSQYQRVLDTFRKEIKTLNKPLHKARVAFAQNSEFVNKLDAAQIRTLNLMRKGDPVSAVDKLVGLQPEQISGLRSMFEKNNQIPAWNDAVRSYVSKLKSASNEKQANRMLKNLIGSEGAKARLKAMLGDEMFAKVEPLLSLEQRYAEGAGKYFAGSPTAPLDAAGEQTQGIIKTILKLISLDKKAMADVAGKFLNTSPSNAVMEDMARIMFSPQGGKEFLQSAIPFAKGYEAYSRGVNAVRQAGGRGAPAVSGRTAKAKR